MRPLNDHPSIVRGYVDPMATRAVGSFAWWCRLVLDAWDDEYPLGDRLREDELATFVGFALHEKALLGYLEQEFPPQSPQPTLQRGLRGERARLGGVAATTR